MRGDVAILLGLTTPYTYSLDCDFIFKHDITLGFEVEVRNVRYRCQLYAVPRVSSYNAPSKQMGMLDDPYDIKRIGILGNTLQ